MQGQLNPYEFTRVNSYLDTGSTGIYKDDYDFIKDLILTRNPNIRKTAEYQNTKSCYYDCTMSCDRDEAFGWISRFLRRALLYGQKTRCLDWQHKFLAAYDILEDFKKGK